MTKLIKVSTIMLANKVGLFECGKKLFESLSNLLQIIATPIHFVRLVGVCEICGM